mmetsp:Transcript_119756/g.344145  ORF Transcript_119756/g.344145 Transcript_119756/m.344145 type:complete len:81 (+) Transcript_119756:201-443(+)
MPGGEAHGYGSIQAPSDVRQLGGLCSECSRSEFCETMKASVSDRDFRFDADNTEFLYDWRATLPRRSSDPAAGGCAAAAA